MSFETNIAEQLKSLRQATGWTQEDLARKLGVSFATVNRWENGKTKPSQLASKGLSSLLKNAKIRGDE